MNEPKPDRDSFPRREAAWVLGMVGLALAIRLGTATLLRSWEFASDEDFWAFGHEMGRIAVSIATGEGFGWPPLSIPPWPVDPPPGPTAWMAPIYPGVIALAFEVFGVYTDSAALCLIVFQSLLSATTCAVLYALGKRLFDARVGLLAGSILAVYPASIHFAVQKIWSTSLFALLLPVLVLSSLRGREEPDRVWGATFGLAFGLTALVNPVVLAALPFVLAWLLLVHRGRRLALAGSIAVALAVLGLVLAPWIVRNRLVFDQFAFVKSNFGHELHLGNNPYATGGPRDPIEGREVVEKVFSPAELEAMEGADEATRNRLHARRAVEFIRARPGRVLELSTIRFVRYWTIPTGVRDARDVAAFGAYSILVLLGLLGFRATPDRTRWVPLLIFVLAIPLPYYVTVVAHYRYRFPIEPLLALLAARGLHHLRVRVHLRAGTSNTRPRA